MGSTNPSAASWFQYATEDIKSARALFDSEIFPAACFHAQQAAEKSFKGLLLFTNEPVGKIHSVTKMVGLTKELKYDEFEPMPKAGKLDIYYLTTRYPDMLPEGSSAVDLYDKDDAAEAIGVAEQTFLLLAKWAVDAGMLISHEDISCVQNGMKRKSPKL